jgi:hypothetical protein
MKLLADLCGVQASNVIMTHQEQKIERRKAQIGNPKARDLVNPVRNEDEAVTNHMASDHEQSLLKEKNCCQFDPELDTSKDDEPQQLGSD